MEKATPASTAAASSALLIGWNCCLPTGKVSTAHPSTRQVMHPWLLGPATCASRAALKRAYLHRPTSIWQSSLPNTCRDPFLCPLLPAPLLQGADIPPLTRTEKRLSCPKANNSNGSFSCLTQIFALCKAHTSCWLLDPRHEASAVPPNDITVDVIKKLLSCCVWYTAHKAVTSTQPNTPPWITCSLPSQLLNMLTQFRSFGQNWLSQGTVQGRSPFSPSLSGYISSTFPLKESEQNFAQSFHSLLCLLPISSTKAFLCQICWSVTDKQLQ